MNKLNCLILLIISFISFPAAAQTNMSIHFEHRCKNDMCSFKVFDYTTEVETVILLDLKPESTLYQLLANTRDTTEYVTYQVSEKLTLDVNGNSIIERTLQFFGFNPASGLYDNQLGLTIYNDCGNRLMDVYSGIDKVCLQQN